MIPASSTLSAVVCNGKRPWQSWVTCCSTQPARNSPSRSSTRRQLFVTNAHNGTGLGTISAYDVSFSGELTSIGASPFADLQTAPCWLTISQNGQFLFAVNIGSGFILSFAISPNGSLTLLGSVSAGPAGTGAVDPVCLPTATA